MKRLLLVIVLLVIVHCLPAVGQLRLAHVFSDHAVLQRESEVAVWGWAEPNAPVAVHTSWNNVTARTRAAGDGSWRVSVATGKAGGSHSIRIRSGKASLTVVDVTFGEVWLCSGQSNMEMPMRGFGFQEVEGFRENLAESAGLASRIRVFDIKADTTHVAQADVDSKWTYTTPQVCCNTSAVAYLFAKRLTRTLDVPVGIIVNAWGGSRIEPWMSWDAVRTAGLSSEELGAIEALHETAGGWPQSTATCWNGRMLPVAGYAIKGFIWYQGCSNIGQSCYDRLQASMVRLWRKAWGLGDIPFIYALLAPYEHGDSDGRWRPEFVRTQLNAQKITPNSYAVCTETLGSKVTVHPPYKREVAEMMASRALGCAYGIDLGISLDYPEPKTVEYLDDGRVRITFTNVWSNLMSISDRNVTGFELAGEDKNFHLADAIVDWDGETVYVSCSDVPAPVAVRYSYRNWMGSNLHTSYGMPVPPFRTDEWK